MARSRIALEGLPHSEIFGSKPVCGSPKLIAAYHVLHRRPAPRHPPYALSSLTTTSTLLEICSGLLSKAPALVARAAGRAPGGARSCALYACEEDLRLSMNPGFAPVVVLTPPVGVRYHETRPLASTSRSR